MKKKLLSLMLSSILTVTSLTAGTSAVFADEEEDYDEINVSWLVTNPLTKEATDPIVEAINEITEKEIGVHVNMTFYDPGAYATQVPMEIQANGNLDLLMYTPIPGSGFQSFYRQGQLMDITDYLEEYGQGVTEALGTLIDGTKSPDGRVYGVASNRVLGSSLYIIMRTDILEELGLLEKAEAMTSWTEFEEILKEVVDKTDLAGIGNSDVAGSTFAIAPFLLGSDSFAENHGFDTLGDTNDLVACNADGHVERF